MDLVTDFNTNRCWKGVVDRVSSETMPTNSPDIVYHWINVIDQPDIITAEVKYRLGGTVPEGYNNRAKHNLKNGLWIMVNCW